MILWGQDPMKATAVCIFMCILLVILHIIMIVLKRWLFNYWINNKLIYYDTKVRFFYRFNEKQKNNTQKKRIDPNNANISNIDNNTNDDKNCSYNNNHVTTTNVNTNLNVDMMHVRIGSKSPSLRSTVNSDVDIPPVSVGDSVAADINLSRENIEINGSD